uniref:Snurportin-1 n=1 Tax=Heterorhabditis bacteriophora TaxID=37862 RepID=A0A1I7XD65_HETBA
MDDLNSLVNQMNNTQVDPEALGNSVVIQHLFDIMIVLLFMFLIGEHPRFSQFKNVGKAAEQQAIRRQEVLYSIVYYFFIFILSWILGGYTILDCILDKNTFYCLDILGWNSHAMSPNPFDFRLFMLNSKLNEIPQISCISKKFTHRFLPLPYCKCEKTLMEKLLSSDLGSGSRHPDLRRKVNSRCNYQDIWLIPGRADASCTRPGAKRIVEINPGQVHIKPDVVRFPGCFTIEIKNLRVGSITFYRSYNIFKIGRKGLNMLILSEMTLF